eukprot:5059311-Prorocentrum_lima.AAC.1
MLLRLHVRPFLPSPSLLRSPSCCEVRVGPSLRHNATLHCRLRSALKYERRGGGVGNRPHTGQRLKWHGQCREVLFGIIRGRMASRPPRRATFK